MLSIFKLMGLYLMSKAGLFIYSAKFILTVGFPLDNEFTAEIGKHVIIVQPTLSCIWRVKMKSGVRTLQAK